MRLGLVFFAVSRVIENCILWPRIEARLSDRRPMSIVQDA
jgi:hypothetical protein